jgi:hypothetical protein
MLGAPSLNRLWIQGWETTIFYFPVNSPPKIALEVVMIVDELCDSL